MYCINMHLPTNSQDPFMTKTKEESMPEIAEYVENLTIVAYPDVSGELKAIIARDNLIDGLQDDDVRLKIRQSRPHHYRLP